MVKVVKVVKPDTVKAFCVVALSVSLLVQCRKPQTQAANPPSNSAHDSGISLADSGVLLAPEAPDATGTQDSGTGVPAVLTIRIINIGSRPIPVFTSPDTNEMLHAKKLRSRRGADAGRDSDPVKFFPIGQMPLCSDDAGAGYGGLGQPERRELAPNESITFEWDGMERQERLDPRRGVCQDVVAPAPGRYRIELDQPRRSIRCTDPEFSWPLRLEPPATVEVRCRLRTPDDDAHSAPEAEQ